MLRIHDILVRIRIRIQLRIRSHIIQSKKLNFVLKFYFAGIIQSKHLWEKEGSGSGSIPPTNGSGSGRSKNMRILRIRIRFQIRIPNTGNHLLESLEWAFIDWMKDHNCPSRQNKYFFTLQSCKTVEKNAKLQYVPHPGTFILIYILYMPCQPRIPSFVNNSLRLNNCLYITTSEHDIFNSRTIQLSFSCTQCADGTFKFLLTNMNISIYIIVPRRLYFPALQ